KCLILLTMGSGNSETGQAKTYVRESNLTATSFDLIIASAYVSTVVCWQVIEFYNVKSLQRGSFTFPTGSGDATEDITVTAVKNYMLISTYTCNTSTTTEPGYAVVASQMT